MSERVLGDIQMHPFINHILFLPLTLKFIQQVVPYFILVPLADCDNVKTVIHLWVLIKMTCWMLSNHIYPYS